MKEKIFEIKENMYNFDINNIFVVGKRHNNPKRSFLFISKLLGKYLAVRPEVVKATGFLLSSLKYQFSNDEYLKCLKTNGNYIPNYESHAKDNDLLVIGFCETATGLGMSVASSIEGCFYETTTREKIKNMKKLLTFEEEHSHATTHNMFSNEIELSNFKKVILVDDEITTGNSLLNLMEEICKKSNLEEISVLTILDWRNANQKERFAAFSTKWNIPIKVYSLISGELKEDDLKIYHNERIKEINDTTFVTSLNIMERISVETEYGMAIDYFKYSGRFGVSYKNIQNLEIKANEIALKIANDLKDNAKNILVLGHGEGIYIPSRVAAYLEKLGYHVKFKTTALSPIYHDGEVIKDITSFIDREKTYHLYNFEDEILENDKIILLTETPLNVKLSFNTIIYNL